MLDREDIEQLKLIFVEKNKCDERTEEINRKLANDNTQLELIKQQLKQISWVAKTTLAAVIAFIVTYILSLVLKG